jgi:hypothetical protein
MLAGLASLWLLTAGAPGVRAQAETSTGSSVESLDDPGEPDRLIGVIGAMVCGAEGYLLRTNPVLGTNPYVLTFGALGCLTALLDVLTT